MHQQIRTVLRRSVGAVGVDPPDTGAAEAEEDLGTLAELLGIVAQRGDSLCLADGKGLHGAGEFVFAIEHPEGDDSPVSEDLAEHLRSNGFPNTHVVDPAPEFAWLEDRAGSLLEELQKIEENTGRRPVELHVGKAPGGRSFVQVTVR